MIKEKIRRAAEKSNRPGNSVCLMAVTKTVAVEKIREVLAMGISTIGENRVQEAADKNEFLRADLISSKAQFHLIGSLQTNKTRKAVELFDVIQSVDRPKLANTLDRLAGELGKKQRCLIEVKISSEETKGGMALHQAADFVDDFSRYKNLSLEGLMTIGKLNAPPEETRRSFRGLLNFFKKHRSKFGETPILSMGMSDDFEIAIEEGSTLVRIGRALFGERA